MKGYIFDLKTGKISFVYKQIKSIDIDEPSVTFINSDGALGKISGFDLTALGIRAIKEDLDLKVGDDIPNNVTDITHSLIVESVDSKVLKLEKNTSFVILELASTQLSNADLMLELANVSLEKEQLKSQLNDVQIELANVLLELATGGEAVQNV